MSILDDLILGPDPERQAAEGSGLGSFIVDPMDLFGKRAKYAGEEIKALLSQSAQESIAQQEEQEAYLRERYQPYYEAATEEGLPTLEAMAMGGEMDYTPSRLFEYQKEKGLERIKTGAAKAGLLHSSATKRRRGEFVADLAGEEAERAYGGQLSTVQLGSGAAEAVGAAGSAVSGQIGALYSNLASGLGATSQFYGQAREAALTSAGSTLMNIGMYQEGQ